MQLPDYIKEGRIKVLAKPNAPKTEIIEWDDVRQALRVSIAAVPDKNKANKALVKFFSKLLKRKVELVRGAKSREKVLRLV